MSKTSKKRLVIVSLLIVIILLLAGCSSKNAIIDTWQDANGQTMQFFSDGTITSGGLISTTGEYSFPDSSHLKIELQGLWGIAGPQVYEYKINGNKLVLIDSLGTTIELTRCVSETAVNSITVKTNSISNDNINSNNTEIIVSERFSVVPYNYRVSDAGNGWNDALIRLCFVNNLDHPIAMTNFTINNILIETLEGKEYTGYILAKEANYGTEYGFNDSNYKELFPTELRMATVKGFMIPTGLQFSAFDEIAFKFATAATPSKVIIMTDEYGSIEFDINSISNKLPIVNTANIKPYSELAKDYAQNSPNSNIDFIFDDSFSAEEDIMNYPHINLLYHAVNKDEFGDQSFSLDFQYCIYAQNDEVCSIFDRYQGDFTRESEGTGNTVVVGPGQTINGKYDLNPGLYHGAYFTGFLENRPFPKYLIYYKSPNNPIVYDITEQ